MRRAKTVAIIASAIAILGLGVEPANALTLGYGARGDVPVPGNYVGDPHTEVTVYRPSTGTWYIRGHAHTQFGVRGDIPVPGNYVGNAHTDIALYRPSTGTWYIRGLGKVRYGARSDVPVPGDYTGDGHTDIALYRPSTGTWYIRGVGMVRYGGGSDIPVPGDYTGDGHTEIALYRPSTGTWYIRGAGMVRYGGGSDIPVPGDYTGDGHTEIALYRPSTGTWYIRGHSRHLYGGRSDIPVPGNYTGDRHADIAVYRPSTSTWYIRSAPITFGNGTHRVGLNIPAGTYRTTHDSAGCYWERLSGFSGSFDDIIANNFTNAHDVVTISPTDRGFETHDCGTWTSDLSPLTTSPRAPFRDGTWIVKTDIGPGSWSAPGGSSCYWERRSGFSGTFDDVIANDFGPTHPVVTISSTDAGFATSDCGTWRRVG